MDLINRVITALCKAETLNQLFDVFKEKVKMLIKADHVHIIMSDINSIGFSTTETFMAEDKGYTRAIKIDGMTLFRALENRKGSNKKTDNEEHFKDLLFDKLDIAYKGSKGKHFIVLPIMKFHSIAKNSGLMSKYPMYCIVQVEKEKRDNHNTFGFREAQILENI